MATGMMYATRTPFAALILGIATCSLACVPALHAQVKELPDIPGPAQCYFEIGGKVIIDGICNVFSEEGDLFMNDLEKSGYEVILTMGSNGDFMYWNKTPANTDANKYEEIPSVRRIGSCWISQSAKACLGEPGSGKPGKPEETCSDCG